MMVMKLMGKPSEVSANMHFFAKLLGGKTTLGELVEKFKVASNEGN